MSKKTFTGENQNLPQLAKDVEEWLRHRGYEVQSGSAKNSYLVQARKESTLRSLLGNNQTIDVRIEGRSDDYSIDVNPGKWVKNLADSGPAAVVAALATIYSLGISAAWSVIERSRIEADLWATKDASCPRCSRIGAADRVGEKLLRAENITLLPSGDYQGTKVFTDVFRCKFCRHAWERGEKPRTALLCPTCHEEGTKEATGEKVISLSMTDQQSDKAQPLGEQVFVNTFRCRACSHAWEGIRESRLVEVCPQCKEVSEGVHVKDTVLDTITRYETRVVADYHTRRTEDRGLGEVNAGTSFRTVQFAVQHEVFTQTFKCTRCGQAWTTGERTRRLPN